MVVVLGKVVRQDRAVGGVDGMAVTGAAIAFGGAGPQLLAEVVREDGVVALEEGDAAGLGVILVAERAARGRGGLGATEHRCTGGCGEEGPAREAVGWHGRFL